MDTYGKSALEIERIKHGLTRKQVGEVLHVSDRTIYDYEHGNTIPAKADTLLALCKLYSLSPGQLREILMDTAQEAQPEQQADLIALSLDELEELCDDSSASDSLDCDSLDELLAAANPIEQIKAYFEDSSVSKYEKIDLLVETIRQYLLHQSGF